MVITENLVENHDVECGNTPIIFSNELNAFAEDAILQFQHPLLNYEQRHYVGKYIQKYYEVYTVRLAMSDPKFLKVFKHSTRFVFCMTEEEQQKILNDKEYLISYFLSKPKLMEYISCTHNTRDKMWNEVREYYLSLPKERDFETLDEFIENCKKNSESNKQQELTKKFEDAQATIDKTSELYKQLQQNFIDIANGNVKKSKEQPKPKIKSIIISKYDKQGQLVKQYNSRQECIDDNGLTKPGLSQHLSGKRKSLKGYIYKEVIHYQ